MSSRPRCGLGCRHHRWRLVDDPSDHPQPVRGRSRIGYEGEPLADDCPVDRRERAGDVVRLDERDEVIERRGIARCLDLQGAGDLRCPTHTQQVDVTRVERGDLHREDAHRSLDIGAGHRQGAGRVARSDGASVVQIAVEGPGARDGTAVDAEGAVDDEVPVEGEGAAGLGEGAAGKEDPGLPGRRDVERAAVGELEGGSAAAAAEVPAPGEVDGALVVDHRGDEPNAVWVAGRRGGVDRAGVRDRAGPDDRAVEAVAGDRAGVEERPAAGVEGDAARAGDGADRTGVGEAVAVAQGEGAGRGRRDDGEAGREVGIDPRGQFGEQDARRGRRSIRGDREGAAAIDLDGVPRDGTAVDAEGAVDDEVPVEGEGAAGLGEGAAGKEDPGLPGRRDVERAAVGELEGGSAAAAAEVPAPGEVDRALVVDHRGDEPNAVWVAGRRGGVDRAGVRDRAGPDDRAVEAVAGDRAGVEERPAAGVEGDAARAGDGADRTGVHQTRSLGTLVQRHDIARAVDTGRVARVRKTRRPPVCVPPGPTPALP